MSEQEIKNARENLEIAKRYGSAKLISKWARIIKQLEAKMAKPEKSA